MSAAKQYFRTSARGKIPLLTPENYQWWCTQFSRELKIIKVWDVVSRIQQRPVSPPIDAEQAVRESIEKSQLEWDELNTKAASTIVQGCLEPIQSVVSFVENAADI